MIYKILFWIISIMIALEQIGVNISIAENTFLILVGAVALAFALAVGIGFGLAMKDEAKNILKQIKRKI